MSRTVNGWSTVATEATEKSPSLIQALPHLNKHETEIYSFKKAKEKSNVSTKLLLIVIRGKEKQELKWKLKNMKGSSTEKN